MNTKRNCECSAQHEPRLAGEILLDYLMNGNEPLAIAYRRKHSNMELCVDVKTLLWSDARPKEGKRYYGTLSRVNEDFFFFEDALETKKVVGTRRNVHLQEGTYCNVNMRYDGVIYPTFRYGLLFYKKISFRDFCSEVAKELLIVASIIGESR